MVLNVVITEFKFVSSAVKYNKDMLQISLWRVVLFNLLFLLIQNPTFSQTGPGGVGNSNGSSGQPQNVLWLDAGTISYSDGDDLTLWPDISGNNNDLSQPNAIYTPIFRDNGGNINGHPRAEFSKDDNRIVINPFSDMPTSGITTFIIYETSDNGDALVSYNTTTQDNAFLLFDNSNLRTDINASNISSGYAFNSGNWQIMSHKWRSSGGNLIINHNGDQVFTATFQNGVSIPVGGSYAIGGEQDAVDGGYNPAQDFDGDIAEVIMYNSFLNSAQRILVENYLSEKYALAFATAANDKYTGNDAAYVYDIAGIGQESDGDHTQTTSEGLYIYEWNSSLANGEYVMLGHDNTTNNSATIRTDAEITTSGAQAAWARDWYIEKTSSDGIDVKLIFDFKEGLTDGQYPANVANYVLLYRAGTSGNYSVVTVAGQGTYDAGQVYFDIADANLSDGYYTIATNDQTNSPVEGVAGRTWYALASGDWDTWDYWTLDPSGALPNNSSNETPAAIDKVVIHTGKTITLNSDTKTLLSITVDGILQLGTSSGHNFTEIKGSGRIRLASDNFPLGNATHFITTGQGEGTVVWQGGSYDLYLASGSEFFNMEFDLDDPANILTLLSDLTINGSLVIETGILQVNDNAATTNLNIEAQGDVLIEAPGQILTGTGNARHQFDIYSNFTNNGIVEFTNRIAANYIAEATDGIVDANFLSANTNQTILCKGTTNFYRIEIDKGSDMTYELSIEATSAANFNLFGYANQTHAAVPQLDDGAGAADNRNPNALGLYRGTVIIGSNITINRLSNSGNYNVSEAARLLVDGGAVYNNFGNSTVPYGIIEVNAGLLESRVNNGITTRDNGLIKINGGTINTNVIKTSVMGAGNVGGYVQSGGTVNIINPGGATNGYYHFCLTYPGNTFNMSGGTLHVYDANGNATSEGGIFIASDPTNINVTGGTVIAEIAGTTSPFKITSTAPFYNLILRNTLNNTTHHVLDSGINVGVSNENLDPQPLVVLNDLTIEDDCFLDHKGQDITIAAGFSISANSQLQPAENNYGLLYDAALPNTLTFNGSTSDTLYIGHDFDDEYELFLWNLTVNKTNGAEIVLKGDPNKDPSLTTVNPEWHNRLINTQGTIDIVDGTFNQGHQSIRLFGPVKVRSTGILGVYEPGVTELTAYVMLKDNDTKLETEDGAELGNFKLNPQGSAIVLLGSNVHIKRIGYWQGLLNLETYKLKVDYLHRNSTLTNYPANNGSTTEMIYSSANASDGGLSILVTGNATYTFPLGTKNTTTRYTYAEVIVTNFSDDGYITIRPVDGELQTTNLGGGDLLDYYWRVDYEGFTNNPIVQYEFKYDDSDIVGAEGGYYPGKVLNINLFSRSYENDLTKVDDANNTITFNDAGAGFILEQASYTAGVGGRFTGGVQIFYLRRNGDWNNNNTWSFTRGGGSAGDYPRAGDVAVIRRLNTSYSGIVTVRSAQNAAAVVFDDENGFASGCPRIIFDAQNNYASYNSNFSTVSVAASHQGGTLNYNTHGAVIQYNIQDSYSAVNAVIFDGTDDYVAIQNFNYSAAGNTTVSVEAWIKTSSGANQVIASFDRNTYWRLEVNGDGAGTGRIGFDVMTDAGQIDLGGNIRIDDGQWHHVAGVFDNGTASIYIDGILDATVSLGATFGTGTTRYGFLGVGSEANTFDGNKGPANYFDGKISEVRIWNTARSQAQILANKDGFISAPYTNLDIYYQMDDGGASTTVTDYANTNDGTLTNMTVPDAWVQGPWAGFFPNGDFGNFNNYPNALVIYSWDVASGNADVTLSDKATEYPQMWFAGGNQSRIFRFPDEDVTVHGGFTIPGQCIVVANGSSDNTITFEQNVSIGHNTCCGFVGQFLFPGNDANTVTVDIKKNLNIRGGAFSLLGIENAAGGTSVHKLIINGNITIEATGGDINLGDGDLAKSNAELELQGLSNNTFTDNAASMADFHRIIMNKGANQTNSFSFNSNFNLNGATDGAGVPKAIELQNGTLIINHALINQNLTTGDDDFRIPAAAALEVRLGQVNAVGNSGIILDGKLLVSGGTVNMSGGDNYIQYSASGNATLEVTVGGSLIVGSQIRRGLSSTEGILNYNQSGGDVIIGENSAPEGNRGVFEILNTGSSFTHSGGSLTLVRQQLNPTFASLYLDPETSNLSSGTTITLGNGSTPVSNEFGIYSTISLQNLTLDNSSIRNPKAKMWTVPLTINGELIIQSGTEFKANSLNLNLYGDFTNSGTFTANSNTTYLKGSSDQEIDGNTTFYNLTNQNTSNLNLTAGNADLRVDNILSLENGVFNDNSNDISVYGNIYNNITHVYGGTGDGISMLGSSQQVMTGNGTYGKLSINNANGVTLPVGNAPVIADFLKLESGVLNIGGNLLTLEINCLIQESNPFGENNMIQTNVSFTDNGVKKFFPSGAGSFIFPVGSGGKYTPVDVNATQNTSTTAYLIAKPADEIHPSIQEDLEDPDPEIVDRDNVLQYYWVLTAIGFTDFSAVIEMGYDPADVEVTPPYTVAHYITAKVLNDGTGNWYKYDDVSKFDEVNRVLIFDFLNAVDIDISGEYTAGVDSSAFNGAIPDQVPLYTSNGSGTTMDWHTAATWVHDVGLPDIPRGARVRILAGDRVQTVSNYISSYTSEILGTLDVNTTFGNRVGNVSGTGTLYTERGSLPAGYYETFFSASGGTVEFGGSTAYSVLSNISQINNVIFSGTNDRELPNLDLTILGDLTIDGSDASLAVINEFDQGMNISGDIVFNTGTYDAGTGDDAIVEFNGTTVQTISGTGSFTTGNAFNHVILNNSAGLSLSAPAEIDGNLTFTNGIITTTAVNLLTIDNTSETAVSGYSTSRYVDGPMRKNILDNGTFIFPVGDASRYGRVEVINTSTTGTQYWEAEYYNSNPHTFPMDTSLREAGLELISGNEYWRIEGPAGDNSELRIRWDGLSSLPAMTSDRANNIKMVEWLSGEWQVVDATVTDGGVSSGTILSDNSINLDEHFFTIGTFEPAPLPTAGFITIDTSICAGTSANLRVQLGGAPNWTYYVHDGTSTTIYTPIATSLHIFTVTPGVTTTYTIDSVADATGVTTSATISGSPVIVTVIAIPIAYNVTGGGAYCAGSAGVAIGLDNSDNGIDYQLLFGGAAVGATVAGDGSPITFGNLIAAGVYTIEAADGMGICTQPMTGNALVTVNPVPALTLTVVAPLDTICDGTNTQLTINFTAGTANFDFTITDGATSENLTVSANPYTYTPATAPVWLDDGSPDTDYYYSITTITDANGCTSTNLGNEQVTVFKIPETGPQYHIENTWAQ